MQTSKDLDIECIKNVIALHITGSSANGYCLHVSQTGCYTLKQRESKKKKDGRAQVYNDGSQQLR